MMGAGMRSVGRLRCTLVLSCTIALLLAPAASAVAPDTGTLARQLTTTLADAFNTGKRLQLTLTCEKPAMVAGKSCLQRLVAAVRVDNIVSVHAIEPDAPCLKGQEAGPSDRCVLVTYGGGAVARFAATADGQILAMDLTMRAS